MSALKFQAIQTALTGNWENAITLNLEVLKETPGDIDTLNRLAFAMSVIGKIKEAKSTYQKVLRIDKKNPIALKNLKRLVDLPVNKILSRQKAKGGKKSKNSKNKDSNFDSVEGIGLVNNLFLEESGKTKIVDLIHLASPRIVSFLLTGELLILRVKRLKVFVLDRKDQYIGVLPDNIAKRLIEFISGGNSYCAFVKSSHNNHVSVFIKETKRATRFKNQPSFSFSERGKMKKDIVFAKRDEKEDSSYSEEED